MLLYKYYSGTIQVLFVTVSTDTYINYLFTTILSMTHIYTHTEREREREIERENSVVTNLTNPTLYD
jgi:hypothetical protein